MKQYEYKTAVSELLKPASIMKRIHFKKANVAGGRLNVLLIPTIAYSKYDSERWKYRHVVAFGWLCWTYAICIE